MKKFNVLQEIITATEKDAVKFFEKGNNAAGTRLRKALQEAKTIATDIRKEISDLKNKTA